MKINPYLSFNGDCAAAFKFYESVLAGEITMTMTYADAPPEMNSAPEMRDKIMHISMKIGDTVLMGSDSPPHYTEKPAGFSVSVVLTDPQEAERVFAALAKGGETRMEIQPTFWAERFGMVQDKFGVPWMINCEKSS